MAPLDKYLCTFGSVGDWVIFSGSDVVRLRDRGRMRLFFFSSRDPKTPIRIHSLGLVSNNITECNLWEHLETKIQPVIPRYICISQPCVYSDAQFTPLEPINRSDEETVGVREGGGAE